MEVLAPLTLGIALFITIAVIVKTISDNKTRRHLIDKGVLDDKLKSLFEESPEFRILSVLKWAFVLIGVGAAVLVGRMAPLGQEREYMMAFMFLFAGIGLVLYYVIARFTLRQK